MDSYQPYNDDLYKQESNLSTYPDWFANLNYNTLNETYMDFYDGISYHDNIRFERIVVPVIIGLVIVVGIVGNLLLMTTIGLNPAMRTIRHLLVFNLSVASLCLLVLCLPFIAITKAIYDWPFGDAWCKLCSHFKVVSEYVTVYTLVTIAAVEFDYSVAFLLPPCLQRIGRKAVAYTIVCVIAAWVLFLASLSPLIAYRRTKPLHFTLTGAYTFCISDMTAEETQIETICHLVLGYGVPLCMSFVLCVCALVKSSPSLPQTQAQSTTNEGTQSSYRHEAVTCLIMIIVVTVLWGPKWIHLLFRLNSIYVVDNLSYFPSSVFPIILFARSDELRQGLKTMCRCTNPPVQRLDHDKPCSIDLLPTIHAPEAPSEKI